MDDLLRGNLGKKNKKEYIYFGKSKKGTDLKREKIMAFFRVFFRNICNIHYFKWSDERKIYKRGNDSQFNLKVIFYKIFEDNYFYWIEEELNFCAHLLRPIHLVTKNIIFVYKNKTNNKVHVIYICLSLYSHHILYLMYNVY